MTATATTRPSGLNALFIMGAVLALSHLANEWARIEPPFGPAWKCIGIVLLGVFALSQRAVLVALALFASAAGDVFLELDGLFIAGMAAFGLAHIFYAAVFIRIIQRDGLSRSRWPLAALVLIASFALGLWFAPGQWETGLALPSRIYQVIISAMVVSAMMSKASWMAKAGAAIFMLSDTLIAVGLFANIDVIPGAVWITYAGAQILLAWSLTRPRVILGQAA
jgi:uncharacterized membrane protein YhhN